jgi:hypothetical protein
MSAQRQGLVFDAETGEKRIELAGGAVLGHTGDGKALAGYGYRRWSAFDPADGSLRYSWLAFEEGETLAVAASQHSAGRVD